MTSSVRSFVTCTVVLCALCGMVLAQPLSEKPKAAVYIKGNPQGREVLMMAVNTFLIKTGRYQMIAVDAIDLLAQEHIRQQSGSVSDNEIAKLGRDAGAQYVCVVERTEIGGVSYVTTSMVSVQSKIAEFSDIKELPRGEKVIKVIEKQINAMLGIDSDEEHGSGYESVSEQTGQQSPYTGTGKYTSPSSYSSSSSTSDKFDSKSKSRSNAASKPFDLTAAYFTASMSTVDSRDYGYMERSRNTLGIRGGYEAFSSVETKNKFGWGGSMGLCFFEDGIWGFIFGADVKNLFWLVKNHVAFPLSLGFDLRILLANIEKQTAANFIDVMSAADRVSDSTLGMEMMKIDFAPSIGLQIFTNRRMSICVGYVYNVTIPATNSWSAIYKVPGKNYGSDSNGDLFKVPKEYAPLQDPKEHFLGIPGTLRLDLKFHVKN